MITGIISLSAAKHDQAIQQSTVSYQTPLADDSQQPFQPKDSLPPPDVNLSQPAAMQNATPVYNRVPTTEPVIFLTIDDGVSVSEEMLQYMKDNHIKATLFLNDSYIHKHADFFKRLAAQTNSYIAAHTATHPIMTKLDLAHQQQEICANVKTIKTVLDQATKLFRPPYGEYDQNTKIAAKACGVQTLVLWSETLNAGQMAFQEGHTLLPGDIVLMHFRPDSLANLKAIVAIAQAQHLQFDTLDRWVK